ncbi:hypothetical protein QM291_31710, partial [Pseudomonas aeruginosa]|nr:hypothetical protein [Pseudomonas aeruginosa]
AEREEMARQPELQQVLREQLEQIQQRLGRELGKARLVGEALPGAHFDCAEELPSLCDTLRLIHGPHLQVRAVDQAQGVAQRRQLLGAIEMCARQRFADQAGLAQLATEALLDLFQLFAQDLLQLRLARHLLALG